MWQSRGKNGSTKSKQYVTEDKVKNTCAILSSINNNDIDCILTKNRNFTEISNTNRFIPTIKCVVCIEKEQSEYKQYYTITKLRGNESKTNIELNLRTNYIFHRGTLIGVRQSPNPSHETNVLKVVVRFPLGLITFIDFKAELSELVLLYAYNLLSM